MITKSDVDAFYKAADELDALFKKRDELLARQLAAIKKTERVLEEVMGKLYGKEAA